MKKKIITFLLVFIIAFMPVVSFAIPDPRDNFRHHFLYSSSDRIIMYCFNDDAYCDKIWVDTSETPARIYKSEIIPGFKWYYSFDGGETWGDYGGQPSAGYQGTIYTPISSTFVIYGTSDGVQFDVFFSPPRPPIPILVETMETVDSGTILKTILNGLTLLVGFLVLATCLRKGWAFLRRQLTT